MSLTGYADEGRGARWLAEGSYMYTGRALAGARTVPRPTIRAGHEFLWRYVQLLEKHDLPRDLKKKQSILIANGFEHMACNVYFIGIKPDGPIKIGMARNPASRLRDLQVSSPYELEVLASYPGGAFEEKELHRKFDGHHIRGEWFDRSPEILKEIDHVKSFG